jgi:hypothetical protein
MALFGVSLGIALRAGATAAAMGLLATGLWAQTPDLAAARLAELGVEHNRAPVTVETLVDVQMIGLRREAAQTLTDADLAHFAFVPRLATLTLDNAQALSPEGLAQLAQVSRLRRLNLRNMDLTPAHLEALIALPALETLDLSNNREIDGRIVAMLHQMAGLQGLSLYPYDSNNLGKSGI